jgi:hypothetical protein
MRFLEVGIPDGQSPKLLKIETGHTNSCHCVIKSYLFHEIKHI